MNKSMWVVFWTVGSHLEELEDLWVVAGTEEQALAELEDLEERDDVFAAGIAPIFKATEPHYTNW